MPAPPSIRLLVLLASLNILSAESDHGSQIDVFPQHDGIEADPATSALLNNKRHRRQSTETGSRQEDASRESTDHSLEDDNDKHGSDQGDRVIQGTVDESDETEEPVDLMAPDSATSNVGGGFNSREESNPQTPPTVSQGPSGNTRHGNPTYHSYKSSSTHLAKAAPRQGAAKVSVSDGINGERRSPSRADEKPSATLVILVITSVLLSVTVTGLIRWRIKRRQDAKRIRQMKEEIQLLEVKRSSLATIYECDCEDAAGPMHRSWCDVAHGVENSSTSRAHVETRRTSANRNTRANIYRPSTRRETSDEDNPAVLCEPLLTVGSTDPREGQTEEWTNHFDPNQSNRELPCSSTDSAHLGTSPTSSSVRGLMNSLLVTWRSLSFNREWVGRRWLERHNARQVGDILVQEVTLTSRRSSSDTESVSDTDDSCTGGEAEVSGEDYILRHAQSELTPSTRLLVPDDQASFVCPGGTGVSLPSTPSQTSMAATSPFLYENNEHSTSTSNTNNRTSGHFNPICSSPSWTSEEGAPENWQHTLDHLDSGNTCSPCLGDDTVEWRTLNSVSSTIQQHSPHQGPIAGISVNPPSYTEHAPEMSAEQMRLHTHQDDNRGHKHKQRQRSSSDSRHRANRNHYSAAARETRLAQGESHTHGNTGDENSARTSQRVLNPYQVIITSQDITPRSPGATSSDPTPNFWLISRPRSGSQPLPNTRTDHHFSQPDLNPHENLQPTNQDLECGSNLAGDGSNLAGAGPHLSGGGPNLPGVGSNLAGGGPPFDEGGSNLPFSVSSLPGHDICQLRHLTPPTANAVSPTPTCVSPTLGAVPSLPGPAYSPPTEGVVLQQLADGSQIILLPPPALPSYHTDTPPPYHQ